MYGFLCFLCLDPHSLISPNEILNLNLNIFLFNFRCPLWFPKAECLDKFDSLSSAEKNVVCSCLFYG